jgi:hypothetical protein
MKPNDLISKEAMRTPAQQGIDALQRELGKLPQVHCPLHHSFVPGFYIRQIYMPKGSLVISKIHNAQHPYVITRGRVSVWIEGEGVKHLRAPHTGITQPGTRRVIYIHEDCLWTTFHATDKKVVDEIERDVIYQHEAEPANTEINNELIRQLKEGTW